MNQPNLSDISENIPRQILVSNFDNYPNMFKGKTKAEIKIFMDLITG